MVSDDPILRTLLLVLIIILLVPLLLMFFLFPMMGLWAGGHMWDGGHMWNGGMWNGTGATWMWLIMWLIFLLLVIGIGYLLYRAFRGPSAQITDSALEELRLSYARGELSDEEYEERRSRLEQDN